MLNTQDEMRDSRGRWCRVEDGYLVPVNWPRGKNYGTMVDRAPYEATHDGKVAANIKRKVAAVKAVKKEAKRQGYRGAELDRIVKEERIRQGLKWYQ